MPATPAPDAPASHRLSTGQTLLVGSLVFGLFFGAGNLIFPVEMGRTAGRATLPATIGFLVTAVGLPLVGVIASAVSGSRSVREMTSGVGRGYATVFTCVLYLTIGPLFAIPRTATVSYEVGLAPLVPDGSGRWALLGFTTAFFLLTGLAALRPGRLLDIVGRYLTPIFLVLLGTLLVAALVRPMTTGALPVPGEAYAGSPLTRGLLDGYSTMDALGSLAFAVLIIDAIHRLGVSGTSAVARATARSGVVMLVGMAAIYAALAYVGATSHGVVPDADNGGAVLAGVARHYYGAPGQLLIAAIVLVACLKTAIGLVTACSETFVQLFPRVGYRTWAVGFTVVSAAIANVGLASIVAWSIPVLMFLYPLAITAIVLGLLTPWLARRPLAHRLMTGFAAVAATFDLVKALPVAPPGSAALVGLAERVLPGFALGFGWVVPALVGLALGVVLSRRRVSA